MLLTLYEARYTLPVDCFYSDFCNAMAKSYFISVIQDVRPFDSSKLPFALNKVLFPEM